MYYSYSDKYYVAYALRKVLRHEYYNYYLKDVFDIDLEKLGKYVSGKTLFLDIETSFNDESLGCFFNYNVESKASYAVNRPMLLQFKVEDAQKIFLVDLAGNDIEYRVKRSIRLLQALLLAERVVIHNGRDFDVPVLFEFYKHYDLLSAKENMDEMNEKLFDTFLYYKEKLAENENTKAGLALLVRKFFGIKIDKSEQISDWTQRPFSKSQIEYAMLDPLLLEAIYKEILHRESVSNDVVTIDMLLDSA